MTEVTMPRLSDAMEEGTILRWLKHDGDVVAAEEELVEIETDKATVTHAAETGGTLQIVVPEGATVRVGEVIATVGASVAPPSSPPAPDGAEARGDDGKPADEAVVAAPASTVTTPASSQSAVATPLARRAAGAHGVDLQGVRGSGPGGRITRADVLSAAGVADLGVDAAGEVSRPAAAAPDEPPPDAVTSAPGEDFELREPTRVQRLIARRMAEAKATIPDFSVEAEAVMDRAVAMRADLKDLEDEEGTVPSLNDFVVKACASALGRHPRVNASYVDGRFKLHRRINIGVAVAADDALIVPVVQDADTKSLGAIAQETRRLAARVRDGEISPPELSGATFTVSNLGMFGMTAIRPVINLPQAAILGVGAVREVLARVDGQIIERRVMTLTLTADHRVLYGADAARFLADVKALLESPLKLVL